MTLSPFAVGRQAAREAVNANDVHCSREKSDEAFAWAGEDSNLRRQCRRVYSPFPLATRAPTQEAETLPVGLSPSETAGAGKRSGSQQALHDHDVEPTPELPPDLAFGADRLESDRAR